MLLCSSYHAGRSGNEVEANHPCSCASHIQPTQQPKGGLLKNQNSVNSCLQLRPKLSTTIARGCVWAGTGLISSRKMVNSPIIFLYSGGVSMEAFSPHPTESFISFHLFLSWLREQAVFTLSRWWNGRCLMPHSWLTWMTEVITCCKLEWYLMVCNIHSELMKRSIYDLWGESFSIQQKFFKTHFLITYIWYQISANVYAFYLGVCHR